MIDYDAASKSYDNTRTASERLIALFHNQIHFSASTAVLDFGCGIHGCHCYGVEPSDGMRKRAKEKSPDIVVEKGDHAHIPFPDSFFDFIYLTDVIHHVPNLDEMFSTVKAKLKSNGILCIVTESHAQIERRFYNRYFPSLAGNEKKRYPDVQRILTSAENSHFRLIVTELREESATARVSEHLIQTVEEKNFSMFRLLSDEEYSAGLQRMKHDLALTFENQGAGDTLIWLHQSSAPILANATGASSR